MPTNEVVFLAIFVLPVLLLMLLRVNATYIFLSLCLGYVIAQLLRPDIHSLVSLFLPRAMVSADIISLTLLFAPALLSMVFLIKSVKGSTLKLVLNILPSLATAALFIYLLVPMLPGGSSQHITQLALWHDLVRLESLVIGGAAFLCLLFLWFQRPGRSIEEHGKR